MGWVNISSISPKSFKCSYCGEYINSCKGYIFQKEGNFGPFFIYICHNCNFPNKFFKGRRYPGEKYGKDIKHLPEQIKKLYDEARECISVNDFTASVMASRKLLMHIAVEKGAEPNLTFKDYVDYLVQEGFTPPNSEKWIDYIRKKGNEANHEIKIMEENDARELIAFLEMLLIFIYEYSVRMEAKSETKKN